MITLCAYSPHVTYWIMPRLFDDIMKQNFPNEVEKALIYLAFTSYLPVTWYMHDISVAFAQMITHVT